MRLSHVVLAAFLAMTPRATVVAQVDQARAASYFKEAQTLCQRDGGRLWGVSLCGPIALVDGATGTIATNTPAPATQRPATMGYANAALDWGGTRWSTLAWAQIPSDAGLRDMLIMHELFHRVQPALKLLLPDGEPNDHLDTQAGRYWLQLEWRALARALLLTGEGRKRAARDALAFRMQRHRLFAGAAERERVLVINEGLAEYTATRVATASAVEAVDEAIDQLTRVARNPSFVRTFPYPLGTAYGLLLDGWSPGWRRRLKATDDLAVLLMAAAKVRPATDLGVAERRYGGAFLLLTEALREDEQRARLAELRQQFVEGPVLITPGSRNNSFTGNGITNLPGTGTVFPGFRAVAEWGTLTAAAVLMSPDREHLMLPAPGALAGSRLQGPGWVLEVAPGWVIRPGTRPGDQVLVRNDSSGPPQPR